MTKNLGTADRVLRCLAAVGLMLAAFVAPLPIEARVFGFGATAIYLMFTCLKATCLGYRLMGLSTCPAERR